MENKEILSVSTVVDADIRRVWDSWTLPEHIMKWNQASEDWHTPFAENELKPGGRFLSRMASRDGSVSFDFAGRYDVIAPGSYLEYTIDDGRKVKIKFSEEADGVHIVETFEAENSHSPEMQRDGWQAILNTFKKYTEGIGKADK